MNNTLVTITDENGGVLTRGSATIAGFRGSRKSTPYAAEKAAVFIKYRLKTV